MKCSNCGFEIKTANAAFCPECGTKIDAAKMPSVESISPSVATATATMQTMFEHDVNRIWPEWQIEKLLGKGSYGVVYQVVRKDNNLESRAAIKVISIPSNASEIDSLRSEGLDDNGTKSYFKGIVEDFVREIQLMESIKGMQNIVSVEDYKVVEKRETIGWDIYIRMELLTPFNTYITGRNFTEKDVIKLGLDICSALEICAQRNIIHRDIKPENIFVNDFGCFKLGDFGIARKLENMTGGLSQKGTLNYMAPEVANSTKYDSRADIYSLGVVLYRLVNANRLPFLQNENQVLNPNDRKNAIERRIRGEQIPVPSNASVQMANLVLRACAFSPDMRFSSATDMKNALSSVLSGTYQMFNLASNQAFYAAQTSVINEPVNPSSSFTPAVKKEKKKWSKLKVILLSSVAGVLALAVTLTALFFTSPAYSVYQSFNNKEIKDALSEYKSDVQDNFVWKATLNMLLKNKVEQVVNDYKAGETDFEYTIDALNALSEMGFSGTKPKIDEFTEKNMVENALETADDYYEKGDFKNAILEYSKIPESNENYEKAQKQLEKVCNDYLDLMVRTASEYVLIGEFRQAVSYINNTVGALPEGTDISALDTVKAEAYAGYRTDVSNQVTAYVAESKYPEAFALIKEAQEFDSDQFFVDLKATTEKSYVDLTTASVQNYINAGDYVSANRVAQHALTILPGNAALEELKARVERETPTYLLDVVSPYESSRFTKYANGETFSMAGNTYSNGFIFSSGFNYETGYAILNIEGKYTNLSFTAGHIDGAGMRSATIKVYCDNVLSLETTMTAEQLPQTFNVDLTGVKQLKITASFSDTSYGFANVIVK